MVTLAKLLTGLSLLLFPLALAQSLNSLNPPHGCPGFGYCYPDYRVTTGSGELLCSNCTCPLGNTRISAIACDLTTTCETNHCPLLGNWKCEMKQNRPKCLCEDEWTGKECNIETSSPCATMPCLGERGACSAFNGTYKCDCEAGFWGQQCQYTGNPCDGRCMNGGTCTFFDHGASVFCDCPFGFYGEKCLIQLPPTSKHHGCLDDSALGLLSDHGYINAGSTISEILCLDLLRTVRANNKTANFKFATWVYAAKTCYLSNENKLYNPNLLRKFNGCREPAMLGTVGTKDGGQVYEIIEPCDKIKCNTGICLPKTPDSAVCLCPKDTSGARCQFGASVDKRPPECYTKDCGAGTCVQTDDSYENYCKCIDGTTDKTSCVSDPCAADPCENGGTCINTEEGFECSCLNLYIGPTCSVFDACYENKCENEGSCVLQENNLDSTFTCNCTAEWKGVLCEIEILPCDFKPCENGGTCANLLNKERNTKTFNCTCTTGWTGRTCEEDIDECVVLGSDLCTTRDENAQCENLLRGEYKCNCSSPMWTGEQCHINKYIYDIVNATYGYVTEEDLDKLTKELIGDPTAIRDLVPFLIGSYSTETRLRLSWDYEDIFTWAAYEEKMVDFRNDFVRWNDKVLGNCFTFNHQNSSTMYQARTNGYPGGLALRAMVHSEEYLPWIETAGLMVFTHSTTESIFSESPRINCRASHLASMNIYPTVHDRLGGVYGKCIRDKSEVASYYYAGSYTTDGCLRSCYQDVMKSNCGCMDPRYPMPEEEKVCGMGERVCIEEKVDSKGDPSQWKECVCPLSCHSEAYDVRWSEQPFINQNMECENSKNKQQCMRAAKDTVELNAGLPSLAMHTFVEVPKMDLMSFLSQLGGLLGVLMGFSFVSFIEFGFLFAKLANIFMSKETKRKDIQPDQ